MDMQYVVIYHDTHTDPDVVGPFATFRDAERWMIDAVIRYIRTYDPAVWHERHASADLMESLPLGDAVKYFWATARDQLDYLRVDVCPLTTVEAFEPAWR